MTGRSARLGDGRRSTRVLYSGIARMTMRGPAEHAILEIAGELDFSAADDILAIVARLPHHIVSIDIAGLEFIDGTGVRMLEQLRDDRASLHGERPAVIGASPAIERTIRFVRSRAARLAY